MPRPAPLLSRTPATASSSPKTLGVGANTREVLLEEGVLPEEVDRLVATGAVKQAKPEDRV